MVANTPRELQKACAVGWNAEWLKKLAAKVGKNLGPPPPRYCPGSLIHRGLLMSEPSPHHSHSSQAVWLTLITAISGIVVAIIANWTSLFSASPESPQVSTHRDMPQKANGPAAHKSADSAAARAQAEPIQVFTPHKIRMNISYSVPCKEWISYKRYGADSWDYRWITTREPKSSSFILTHEVSGKPFTTDYGALIRVAVPLDIESTLYAKVNKLRNENLLEKQAVRMTLVDGVFETPTLKCEY